jgi:sortase A
MNVTKQVLAKRRTVVQSCLRLAFYIFLAIGLLAASYVGYIIADAKAYQAIQLPKFAHDVPIVEPHFPRIGEAIGEIQIASVGLRAVIIQGDSAQVLRIGVGHLPETSMPGKPGKVALAGHRDSFFRPLRRVRAGDVITLRMNTGTFHYKVDSTTVVSSRDVGVLRPSGRNELTLVTCFPFNYIGAAPNRFIVHAYEVGAHETVVNKQPL